ncbi:hypothetical protein GCM10009525_77910 [Streptosporangium amethystogenes subsp. fukuiense]
MPVEAVAGVGAHQRGEDGDGDKGKEKPEHFRLLGVGSEVGASEEGRGSSRLRRFRLTCLIYVSASIYVYRDLLVVSL